jgi:hypothetical protein
MRILAALALAAALSACSAEQMAGAPEGKVAADYAAAPAAAPEEAQAAGEAGEATAARGGGPAEPSPAPAPEPVLYLAYSYATALELPAAEIAGVMDRHVQACMSAGARLCQLVGSHRDGHPKAYVSGVVTLRGEPQWLRGFMGGIETQARDAGGRIRSSTVSSEDLTRAIIDTEATLRAKRALRERLQRLLESRPGRLSDLLEVERELARVQAEIDSTDSTLAAMRTRVSMSMLSLSYESQPRSVAANTFEPLTQAFAGFLGTMVVVTAGIVQVVAALLPLALMAGLGTWGLLALRRARGGRLLPQRGPPPSPQG